MTRHQRISVVVCALSALVITASAAFAHHSQAMYEPDKLSTIKGVVTKFHWVNPHTWLYVDVTDDKGKVTNWAIETNAAVSMKKLGWTRTQFKAGDPVTVTMSPRKDGTAEGMLRKVIMPGGTEFSMPGNGPQKPR